MTPRGARAADGYIHRIRNAMFVGKDLEEGLLDDAGNMRRFPTLRKQVTETHRKGLEIAEEDT